jgi:hypothetical protein
MTESTPALTPGEDVEGVDAGDVETPGEDWLGAAVAATGEPVAEPPTALEHAANRRSRPASESGRIECFMVRGIVRGDPDTRGSLPQQRATGSGGK